MENVILSERIPYLDAAVETAIFLYAYAILPTIIIGISKSISSHCFIYRDELNLYLSFSWGEGGGAGLKKRGFLGDMRGEKIYFLEFRRKS